MRDNGVQPQPIVSGVVVSRAGILAALVCAGCGSSSPVRTKPGVIGNAAVHQIAIAVIAPTSDEGKTVGDAARAAIHLAIDRLHDDESRPLAVDSIEVIELDGGSATSGDVLAAAEIVRSRTDIVAIIVAMPESSITRTIDQLRATGTEAALLQLSPDLRGVADVDVASADEDLASAMAQLAGANLHARHPAMVVSGDNAADLSQEVVNLEQAVERFGLTLAYQTFPFTLAGGIDPLGDLAASQPDVICLDGNPDVLDRVIRESRLHQLAADFVLPPDFDTPAIRAAIASAGVHAYLLVPFAPDLDGSPAQAFAEALRQRSGITADLSAALAYDAAEIVIEALRVADQPLDPKSVRAAITGALGDIPGATGMFHTDGAARVHRDLVARELYGDGDTPVFTVSP